MAFRRAPRVPSSPETLRYACFEPRRVWTAFALGAALAVTGLGALAANVAAAHGPFGMFSMGFAESGAGSGGFRQERLDGGDGGYRGYRAAFDDYAPGHRRRRHIELAERHAHSLHARISVYSAPRAASAQPECVRLCDGYHFPLAAVAADPTAQAGACNSQCPDAPTEVYYLGASGQIEDAVSAQGQLYSALPVALRYRTTFDNTCTCHRDGVAAYKPLDDATLKRGDAVMTPAGVVVFSGVEGAAHKAGDFTALANARVSAEQRVALQAMERVSLAKPRPSLKDWLASQGSGRRPDTLALSRPLKVAKADDRIRLLTWRGSAQD